MFMNPNGFSPTSSYVSCIYAILNKVLSFYYNKWNGSAFVQCGSFCLGLMGLRVPYPNVQKLHRRYIEIHISAKIENIL